MPNRGSEQRGSSGRQVTPPRTFDTTPPPQPSGDYTYTVEIVMRMQETMGKLSEAVDGLKEKQAEQGKKLDRISHQVYAAIVVLTLLGGVLWYFANSINNLIAHLISASAQQQQQQQPAQSSPSPPVSPKK